MLHAALCADLHKASMESYMCETGIVLEELRFHLQHLPRWVRERRVLTPLAQFPARSFLSPEPYGLVLIIAPWNYPLQLCLVPLIGAISAGNCAIVKPSAYAPATSAAVAKLLGDAFSPAHIAVVEGGREENKALLEERFDSIFFTGSTHAGRDVMQKAAEHLTPVTLELGGKSPVIVDSSADVPLAAKRIAFGKVLNAGQTCVAPDYLLLHRSLKAPFVRAFREALEAFFPGGDMAGMTRIINEKHYKRIKGLLEGQRILTGGAYDDASRFIAPSLLDEPVPDSPVMQEEIFGPLLPLLCFDGLHEAVDFVRARPKPLALYLFTRDSAAERYVLDRCSFGGGCINDTIIHLATTRLPFGGVGESGMGSYHGKKSFETFTHMRSIVKKSGQIDLPMRYLPYTEEKLRLVRRFLR